MAYAKAPIITIYKHFRIYFEEYADDYIQLNHTRILFLINNKIK